MEGRGGGDGGGGTTNLRRACFGWFDAFLSPLLRIFLISITGGGSAARKARIRQKNWEEMQESEEERNGKRRG